MLTELERLERRTGRGGRDLIDHGPHGFDDLAVCVAGLAVGLGVERVKIRPQDFMIGPPLLTETAWPEGASVAGLSAAEIERLDLNVIPEQIHPEDMPASYWRDRDVYGSPF